ncbi:MAG: amidohydrolase family protein [Phycisphaerales bacterium]|nr:MAG: amidohydrolase family protein [Phycisphaerales bacterium]
MRIPGLVDLQVNGYKGTDFSGAELTDEAFVQASQELMAAGTTAFLPTLITSPTEIYERNLPIIARAMNEPELKNHVLGIHLEGPFLSPQEGARGAHDAAHTRAPDTAYLEQLIAWADGRIRLLTIAADLEGAEDLARRAARHGITVSLGHHMATEDDLDRLVGAGARALTHLGNGIPALLPRHHNPVWAGLANDQLSAMIIADGHHVPKSLLQTIIRAKGPKRCIVVSDGSPLAGLLPGQYETMGTQVVLDPAGRLYDPATGYMAGSSATLLQCANHMASLDLVTARELIAMVFDNPLRLIDVEPGQVRTESSIRFDEQRQLFCCEEKDVTPR